MGSETPKPIEKLANLYPLTEQLKKVDLSKLQADKVQIESYSEKGKPHTMTDALELMIKEKGPEGRKMRDAVLARAAQHPTEYNVSVVHAGDSYEIGGGFLHIVKADKTEYYINLTDDAQLKPADVTKQITKREDIKQETQKAWRNKREAFNSGVLYDVFKALGEPYTEQRRDEIWSAMQGDSGFENYLKTTNPGNLGTNFNKINLVGGYNKNAIQNLTMIEYLRWMNASGKKVEPGKQPGKIDDKSGKVKPDKLPGKIDDKGGKVKPDKLPGKIDDKGGKVKPDKLPGKIDDKGGKAKPDKLPGKIDDKGGKAKPDKLPGKIDDKSAKEGPGTRQEWEKPLPNLPPEQQSELQGLVNQLRTIGTLRMVSETDAKRIGKPLLETLKNRETGDYQVTVEITDKDKYYLSRQVTKYSVTVKLNLGKKPSFDCKLNLPTIEEEESYPTFQTSNPEVILNYVVNASRDYIDRMENYAILSRYFKDYNERRSSTEFEFTNKNPGADKVEKVVVYNSPRKNGESGVITWRDGSKRTFSINHEIEMKNGAYANKVLEMMKPYIEGEKTINTPLNFAVNSLRKIGDIVREGTVKDTNKGIDKKFVDIKITEKGKEYFARVLVIPENPANKQFVVTAIGSANLNFDDPKNQNVSYSFATAEDAKKNIIDYMQAIEKSEIRPY